MATITLKEALLAEFDEEMAATRRTLESVPEDQFGWKPHDKSMTLGQLAKHPGLLPAGAEIIIRKRGSRPAEIETKVELLAEFHRNAKAGGEALAAVNEEQLVGVVYGTPEIRKPMWQILRGPGLDEPPIHHRAQLSVHLRLLDVALPGMYRRHSAIKAKEFRRM